MSGSLYVIRHWKMCNLTDFFSLNVEIFFQDLYLQMEYLRYLLHFLVMDRFLHLYQPRHQYLPLYLHLFLLQVRNIGFVYFSYLKHIVIYFRNAYFTCLKVNEYCLIYSSAVKVLAFIDLKISLVLWMGVK